MYIHLYIRSQFKLFFLLLSVKGDWIYLALYLKFYLVVKAIELVLCIIVINEMTSKSFRKY